MNISTQYFSTLLITGIIHLALAIFVLLKGINKRINQTYFLYSASIAVWAILEAFSLTAPDKTTALFLWQICYIGVIFIPIGFVHFVYSWVGITGWKRRLIPISYVIAVIFVVINFTKLLILEVVPKFTIEYFINPGLLHLPFFILWVAWVIYGLSELFNAYFKSSGERRNQMKYFCWSMLIAYIGGVPNFLPVYNIYIPILMPFGTYAIPIYAFFTAYAIAKHRLMDINIFIRKGLVYSVLITIITTTYFLLVFFMEQVFHGFMGYKSIVWTLFVVVMFILILNPLRNRIQRFIDRYFFRGSAEVLQQQVEHLEEEVRRADRLRAVGTLAAGMAHEIRSPLTAIRLFCEEMSSKYNDSNFRQKFQKIVIGEVDRIDNLLNQLLDLSKPSPPMLEEANVNDIIDQTLNLLEAKYKYSGVSIIKEYSQQAIIVSADPKQLKQVFLNLFMNAIDAMEGADLKSDKKLTVSLKYDNNFIKIGIKDTGPGISKENLNYIFEPFYSTKDKGTGLGLSIVYNIIQNHKGSIRVNSILGKETEFTIGLPAKSHQA